ncbi:MAG: hypothetical protein AB9891_16140 [Anaerolineaceae bacterium]
MNKNLSLPDTNHLSVVTATILFAYALTPFVDLPERNLNFQIPGFFFVLRINFVTLVSILAAGLAMAGAIWLVEEHPDRPKKNAFIHGLLPGLTAWMIGVPLSSLTVDLQWWVVFAFGGVLLTLVFAAEYIVVDISDARIGPATVGLTAISFAMYLILAVTARASSLRLYLLLPPLVATLGLITWRTLYLRLGGKRSLHWGVAISILVGQFAIGIHYWPLLPLRYGLILLAASSALTSLAGGLDEKLPVRTIWIEPAVLLVLFLGFAFLV